MPEPGTRALYLASRSPRRRELLASWGIAFRVVEAGPEGAPAEVPPELAVLQLARAKAEGASLAGLPPGLVLGADTLVVLPGDRLLGKPRDRDEAAEFLEALSGRTHRVVTGLWLRDHPATGLGRGGVDSALVAFRKLDEGEIQAYLECGEWAGKAGAYGLQGRARAFVARLSGEEETVIGLPRSLTLWALEAPGAR